MFIIWITKDCLQLKKGQGEFSRRKSNSFILKMLPSLQMLPHEISNPSAQWRRKICGAVGVSPTLQTKKQKPMSQARGMPRIQYVYRPCVLNSGVQSLPSQWCPLAAMSWPVFMLMWYTFYSDNQNTGLCSDWFDNNLIRCRIFLWLERNLIRYRSRHATDKGSLKATSS